MAEELIISQSADKKEKYESLLPQIEALVTSEQDPIANMANVASALKYGLDLFWVGFYQVKGEELVLAPFQGPIACTRIRKGKGVCGAAWEQKETIIVPDVDQFPGHIACSSESRSEIVIPGMLNGEVQWVLDIDSTEVNSFDTIDQYYLERLCTYLLPKNS